MGTFEVDKEGLARLARRRGLSFCITDLWQNCADTDASRIEIKLEKLPGRPMAQLTVTDDDPNGFNDLSHAFTLFAKSEKLNNPEKRGRFNFGEKLVIAICDSCEISSTTGTIKFENDKRIRTNHKREFGSQFVGRIKMNQEEFNDCCKTVKSLLVPENVVTIFNGEPIPYRKPFRSFEATLPTVIPDENGILRPTQRKTKISVHKLKEGEIGAIYEMGIPIVETGDKFLIDILQKVPLTVDRDNVTPSYLEKVRTLVLNNVFDTLEADDAVTSWVREAAASKFCSEEATNKLLDLRFGEKRVSFDPSDPEANNLAMARGFTVIPGRALSAGEWQNVKAAGSLLPAGQVTPSKPKNTVEPEFFNPRELTLGMSFIEEFVKVAGKAILNISVRVEFIKNRNVAHAATWGGSTLTFCVGILGKSWFDEIDEKQLNLIIHEFAHYESGNHFDERYHKALSKIGAKMTLFALQNPKWFRNLGAKNVK